MTRPNILFLIVHDLGTRLGCYGEPSVQTPDLDALAEGGVRFENHFFTAWGAQSNTTGFRLTARLVMNAASNEPSVG